MDDATLARLEHGNMLETMVSLIANVSGSLVRRGDGVALLASGLPARFFNQVVIEDDRATADGLATAVATMRERGAPFLVHLRRGIDDLMAPIVKELGLELPVDHGPMPGMALDPIPSSVTPVAHGHEIRRVDNSAGMDDHIRTAALGFGMSDEILRAVVAPDSWQRPGTAVYVGYTDGEAVSTGLGFRTGTTIGVYNISTIESARRRGLGAAMTERVASDGARDGCDVAILQSSPLGRQVYERLGFRTVVAYDGWIEPGSPTAGT